MMAAIYRALLREIEHDQFRVLRQRTSLTPLRKMWLAWKVQALGRA
jgi:phytoene synthase